MPLWVMVGAMVATTVADVVFGKPWLLAIGLLWPLLAVRRGSRVPLEMLWGWWALSELLMAEQGWPGPAAALATIVLLDERVQRQIERRRWCSVLLLTFPVMALVTHQSAWLFAAWILYPWRLAMFTEVSRNRVLAVWGWWAACLMALVVHHRWEGALLATAVLASRSVQRQLDSHRMLWMPLAWVALCSAVAYGAHLPGRDGLVLFWVLFPLWRPRIVEEGRLLWAGWAACLYLLAQTAGMPLTLVAAPLVLAGRAAQRQWELATSKRDFASMVSHELRTPIAALRLHAEMLEHHLVTDPDEVEACYKTLGEQARRLQHLTETILDLSRVERGVRIFKQVPSSLNDVVNDAVGQVGEETATALAADLPLASIDREAATQVVVNLLQNAHRYAREVSVATEFDRRWVYVYVRDRGPGIPRDRQARIFEPYVRGSESGKGLGLGLALVRRYMEGQGGRVSAQDRPGGGCVMKVQFRR